MTIDWCSARSGVILVRMPPRALDPASTLSWRDWYSLQRWRKRAKHQLRVEPLCQICLQQGHVSPATVADHIEPHNGDWNSFLLGALQSLCRDCHARKWAADAKGGKPEIGYSRDIGVDGWPIDPRHPANRGR
jgi:5-methylcytosine-specific restriction enzyme A